MDCFSWMVRNLRTTGGRSRKAYNQVHEYSHHYVKPKLGGTERGGEFDHGGNVCPFVMQLSALRTAILGGTSRLKW